MLRFFTTSAVGLDITSRSVRAGLLSMSKGTVDLSASREVPLTGGVVAESFLGPTIKDGDALAGALRSLLKDLGAGRTRRAGLSLPDALFRVQMLDFDELPSSAVDRDRLIRWRLEKTAAFETEGTTLRSHTVSRGDGGVSVLACSARTDVIAQYEDLLGVLGLEPWSVAPASFHALNCLAPVAAGKGAQAYVLVWVTETSYCTLVVEGGELRFYRYREIKAGEPGSVANRLVRELGDTLHFYTHLDRRRPAEIGHLFLAGDAPVLGPLAGGLKDSTMLEVGILAPDTPRSGEEAGGALAPVIGAGGWL